MSHTSPASAAAVPAEGSDEHRDATAAVPEGASPEQFATLPDGVRICYQTFGDASGDPLLLVMGLGGPMTWWDPEFCRMLAERGFFVIRYDNRDTGRSSRVKGRVTRAMLVRSFVGRGGRPPYTLDDMAGDGFALLDHLGSDAAHVTGISMGGMIAQTMAILRPERVLSLTSIMSTTGRRTVGWQDPRLLPRLLERRATTREAYIESSARFWNIIGSVAYPDTKEAVIERAGETWDRGISASGVLRQMVAIVGQPDRSSQLKDIKAPTLVIHGLNDKMVHVSGGRATARAIPGAELLLVPGMGHDLPAALYGTFVDAIRRLASAAARPDSAG